MNAKRKPRKKPKKAKPQRGELQPTQSLAGQSPLEKSKGARLVVVGVLFVTLLAGGFFISQLPGRDRIAIAPKQVAAEYVGVQVCASCHAEETKQWRGSDHALAMQVANEQTVLGDFKNACFTYAGVTSTFYKRDGKFFVRTDGPGGQLHDYEIAYTFGVRPLQQYLIAFPDGRLQALGIAWDTRPRSQGGQRWFHLYPNEKITHTDPLHWTGRNQNWNYMCAECHSTNLRRNYNLARDRYATTWSEINVSCEACHGPGSKHVAWAKAYQSGAALKEDSTKGLVIALGQEGEWVLKDPASGTKVLSGQSRARLEVETCAPCHSRRRSITSEPKVGHPFLDSYMPILLEDGEYHPDGQILGEVYEYGSFTQSKMYRMGVTCSNCHHPHTLKLKVAGNNICLQCHTTAKFDTVAHHRHKPGTEAAQCVNCHMLKKNYMVIDPRRDHSFRVPRPDLSVRYGTPNTCNQCHTGKSAKWTADAIVRWYGPKRKSGPQFVGAIEGGRRGHPQTEKALTAVVTDPQQPAIVRATALSLLRDYLDPASLPAIQLGLKDSDPLVRAVAVRALEPLPPQERWSMASPLLRDPVRAVRIEAAQVLADTPSELMSAQERTDLERAIEEYIGAEMASAERPESHLNLSILYTRLGRLREAEESLRIALRLDPRFVPALVNLADLYRTQGRDNEGEKLLRRAIVVAPNAVEPIYALGLLKGRQQQYKEAIELLGKAARLRPDVARYSYTYGVALQASGDIGKAISVLERAHRRHPTDRYILIALTTMQRDRGAIQSAIGYAEKLVRLLPNDPQARALLEQLRRQKNSSP